MADLRALVRTVHATPGVRGALAAGRDGLLIDAAGLDAERAEHVAALAPALTRAAAQLGEAAGHGEPQAVVVESAPGVLVTLPLSPDVTLVAVVGGADGATGSGEAVGEAVYALRRARGRFAAQAGPPHP